MNKVLRLVTLLILICIHGLAQEWSLLAQRKLESPINICDLDRLGNIYLGDSKGNIHKLDLTGNVMAQFASRQYGNLSMLESWASLRVFLFYEDLQQYGFLDRFLNPSEFLSFPSDIIGLVKLVAPSSDNQMWLLDTRPLSLTKFDINFNSISLTQPLNRLTDSLDFKPYHLLEYQNRVYLGDEDSGILVFDNLGNYLITLKKPGAQRFYPWRESLYYLDQNQLHLISIYREAKQVIRLPDHQVVNYHHALMADNRVILVAGDYIYIYHYKPL